MQPAQTSLGRIVYGGNGLQPDIVIEEGELTALSQQILLRGLMFDFITHYLGAHAETDAGFQAGAEQMEEFRAFLLERELEVDEEQWRQDYDYLRFRLTGETVNRLAGDEAGFRSVLPHDRQIQQAIDLIDQAVEMLRRKLQAEG
jgi:carboxyl-terminal processing protease